MKVSLKLEIRVEYECNGVSHAELVSALHLAARHLADNGLLTGENEAEVESWDCDVTDILY